MDNTVKVSVFCTVYNHEKYLRQCLDGFVMQKANFKFEVLVHDDASTDHSADIIQEYAEKYPEIIKPTYQTENQYSQGVKISKTFLLPKAKGKYIAFCEGDDFWISENKLQMQYDAMETHPDCVACFAKVVCCNEDGSNNRKREFPPKKMMLLEGEIGQVKFAEELFSNLTFFQTSSYFLRREVVEKANNSEYREYFNGDANYLRTALACGDIYYIDKPFSVYRLFSVGSWSFRQKTIDEAERIRGIERNYRGHLVYDSATDYRFHEIICKGQRIINCTKIAGLNYKESILPLLSLMDISRRELFETVSPKQKIKLISIFHFPFLLRTYKMFKRMINR